MDQFVGSPFTRSVVGVHGPGVSVFGLPEKTCLFKNMSFMIIVP